MSTEQARLDAYMQAALTGLLANPKTSLPSLDSGNTYLITAAYTVAKLAVNYVDTQAQIATPIDTSTGN